MQNLQAELSCHFFAENSQCGGEKYINVTQANILDGKNKHQVKKKV